MALDADPLRVHRLVGFKVVEEAAGAPSPGGERAPVVQRARLALVHEADDARRQPGAAVGLHAPGIQVRVAPSLGEELLLPRWPHWRRWAAGATATSRRRAASTRRTET